MLFIAGESVVARILAPREVFKFISSAYRVSRDVAHSIGMERAEWHSSSRGNVNDNYAKIQISPATAGRPDLGDSSSSFQRPGRGTSYIPEIFHRTHVLGPLKGTRVRTEDLAHAAFHLAHRGIFMTLHPLDHTAFHVAQMIDPVPQQCRTEHGYIGACHNQLDKSRST